MDPAIWAVLTDRSVETAVTVRYGDVVVEPLSVAPDSLSSLVPAIIVEVLSPSSVGRDLDVKPQEYLPLRTLEACIVASQTEAACLAWVRGSDGKFPSAPQEFAGDEVIAVPKLGVALNIAEIYRGIPLTTQDNPPHG